MAICYAAAEFLAKEKIKMRRLLRRAHNIEDLSCMENIDMELTFFGSDGGKARGGAE